MPGFQEHLPVAFKRAPQEGWEGTGWEAEGPPAQPRSEAGQVAGLSDAFREMKLGAVCFDE